MSAIIRHLETLNVPFEIIRHERTLTSIEEARALGIDADEVLKTVVISSRLGYVLAVVPASHRVDLEVIREAVGDPFATLATEEQLQNEFPDIELGAFPPLGTVLQAVMFVDPEALRHAMVVFAAGSTTESVRMRTDDLFRLEMVRLLPIREGETVGV